MFMNLTKVLKTCALALTCGLLSAHAVPVVFTGQIDIDPGGGYFIDFGVDDGSPEPTIYELLWDGSVLSDASGNFTSVTPTSPTGWNFSFMQDIVSASYSLHFEQFIEKSPAAISFVLKPADRSVLITQNSDTFITISNLIPTQSYLANIQATDPFVGTFTINALAPGGAPEIDPRTSFLPCIFALGALAAARRRQTA